MIKRVADFCKYSLAFWSVLALCWPALAEQAPNPRGSSTASVTAATSDAATGATSRANSSRVVRVNSAASSGTTPTTTSTVSGRAAATTVSRSATSRHPHRVRHRLMSCVAHRIIRPVRRVRHRLIPLLGHRLHQPRVLQRSLQTFLRLGAVMQNVVKRMQPVWISFVQMQMTHTADACAVPDMMNFVIRKTRLTRH